MNTDSIEIEPQQLALTHVRYEPPAYMTKQGRQMAIDDTLNKVALVMEIMDKAMRDGEHYGTIPGCGEKKALLKGGAEKLGLTFHLKPQFDVTRIDHPNFHREYQVKCILSDGTQGVGTCSTLEGKYRYRAGERKCPKCGKPSIIVGKAEYGGGFLCFAKKGGCGAKFSSDDKTITGQNTARVEHDNPADFWNTCLKMAKKRAHVDSIITATACSDIFTQDVEEAVEAADSASQESKVPAVQTPSAKAQQPAADGASKLLPKGKTVESLIEAGRKKLLADIPSDLERSLWVCLLRRGSIMDNERIADVTASALFPTAAEFCGEAQTGATYETASKAMKGDYDALMNETRSTVATDDEKRAFDAAHGLPGNDRTEPEKPSSAAGRKDAPAVADEWFWNVIISVPRKGQKKAEYEKNPDTIGSLYDAGKNGDEEARKRLWGLAQKMDLQPREFNGKTYPPSEGDKQTRKALDAFLSWEEAKGKQVATHMHEAADGGEPDESDRVPF